MLVIRLARTGRTKYPTYRIVAAESARAATGRFVEVLGNYNPHTKELNLKTDAIKARLANGAQPSNTVIKLLQREQVELPAWVQLKTKAPKPKDEAATEAPAAEAESTAEAEQADAESNSEERVGEVAEDAATVAEDAAPNVNDTETAAADEAQVEATEAAQDAAAEAAETE